MTHRCRTANEEDLPRLVELMAEFYAESGLGLDAPRAASAFEAILEDSRLGTVWVIETEERPIGYMVLTLGFSMEYGGRDAFLDDLYLQPAYRGQGIGTAALETFFEACHALGVNAVHLEVGRDNMAAMALYTKLGFKDNDRRLMTRRLGQPLEHAGTPVHRS